MKKELVRYYNDMNTMKYVNFTQTDFDFFMAICSQVKNQNDKLVVLDYEYLMELTKWNKEKGLRRFNEQLISMSRKAASLSVVRRDGSGFQLFTLFAKFVGDTENKKLYVQVNTEFTYFLNNLQRNFTSFELEEYVGLNGKYPKMLYSQIKQRYNLRGKFWKIGVSELRELFVIPKSVETKKIYHLIIKPALDAVKTCRGMENLHLDILKDCKPGSPVKAYLFTWGDSSKVSDCLDNSNEGENPEDFFVIPECAYEIPFS